MFHRLIHWIQRKLNLPHTGDLRVIVTDLPWYNEPRGSMFIVLSQSHRFSVVHSVRVSGWEIQMCGGGMVFWASDAMIRKTSKSVGA